MSNTYCETSESADKCRKIYVDNPKGKSKPKCLIHGSRHSLDKYKVLGDFGSKYAEIRYTENRGHNPTNRNKYTRQQYNNTIVNSAVDGIILQENNKLSDGTESQEIIETEFDENDLYRIDNVSLEEKKKNLNCIRVRLNANSTMHIRLKSRMV